jgi:predicted deacylase
MYRVKMIKKVNIGKLGTIDVGLPIIEIGKERPTLSIVSGLHGDETKTLIVLKKFIEKIGNYEIKGKIKIFTDANPIAKIFKGRSTIVDCFDMNRIFPGDKDATITQRSASVLLSELKGSSLVIDLHSYHMQTPLMAIAVNTDDKTTMRTIKAFNPKQVWLLNSSKKKESMFNSSLGAELGKLSIPNFAIEINQKNTDNNEIEDCVDGLVRVCGEIGLLKTSPLGNHLRFFERFVFNAKESGLFFPLKKPFETVRKGDLVGQIFDIETFEKIDVLAEKAGTIMQIALNDLVLMGEEIYSIGKEKNGI